MEPNWELLRESVLIIDKVKESKINLAIVIKSCGTIGCAIGHIAMNPKMQKLGIYIDFEKEEVKFEDEEGYPRVASRFFGISKETAIRLFSTRSIKEIEALTDKEVWFKRMKNFFAEHKQPFPELSN